MAKTKTRRAKEPEIRVILRTRRGVFTSIGRARTVEIWIGRRKILKQSTFPMTWLKLKKENVVYQLIIDYLLAKSIKKTEKERIKEAKRLAKEKAKLVRALKKEKRGKKRRVDVETEIVPLITYNRDYEKDLLIKVIVSKAYMRDLLIHKLDLTLKNPLVMDEDNYEEVLDEAREIFLPHLLKFFRANRVSQNIYLLRIKYNTELRDGQMIRTGVGPSRYELRSEDELEDYLDEALTVYFEDRAKDYILKSVGGEIELSGFTFEVIKKML